MLIGGGGANTYVYALYIIIKAHWEGEGGGGGGGVATPPLDPPMHYCTRDQLIQNGQIALDLGHPR